ncbi:MAG: helix-turn-helix domain-containing protein [Bacteroidaceae bacterium]|nr:helix-turn-helix domain-containing protein [Bacteroidaceae bacterium]
MFMVNVGMSLKRIQRIMRFRHATNEIRRVSPDNLDHALCANGYTGHCHFSHEFHDIVGISPTECIVLCESMDSCPFAVPITLHDNHMAIVWLSYAHKTVSCHRHWWLKVGSKNSPF